MKDIFYDLHIHSVLSPCSDDLMTPHNIVLMAKIKGLDMISITDHNSARNLEVIADFCRQVDILLIPGIEIETIEGVHLLGFVEQIETMKLLSEQIEASLGGFMNQPEFFGNQWVMNEVDEVIDTVQTLLIQSTRLTCYEVVQLVHHYGGIVCAAHLNKMNHSIITNLGFIPNDLNLDSVEFNAAVLKQNPSSFTQTKFPIMINSDAHTLGDISEREHSLSLKERSWEGFYDYFMGGNR